MISDEAAVRPGAVLEKDDFQKLIDALAGRGYRVIGPTIREGAITCDDVASVADLPVGWTDEQSAGTYRLKKREDGALFGYGLGPHSWKQFLYPPAVRLWRAERNNGSFQVHDDGADVPRQAFLGVRPCELAALAVQDRILVEGPYPDPGYVARRGSLFLVTVNCLTPGGTCFCGSMNSGPRARIGFDLALTEVIGDGRHFFHVEAGGDAGRELLSGLPVRPARADETELVDRLCEAAGRRMGRQLDTNGLRDLLHRSSEHPRWNEVSQRCLTCANCTMVCPTCFCATVEDTSDLKGRNAERWRRWDSCFTLDFSYIHGGSVRTSASARYRQWMTHKLSTWVDQFGTFGCVGCGRCITWCPAGIDITEEARAIRESDRV